MFSCHERAMILGRQLKCLLLSAVAAGLLMLTGCATSPIDERGQFAQSGPWLRDSGLVLSTLQAADALSAHDKAWVHFRLPGKRATEFSFVQHQGRNAVMAYADASASMLRKSVHLAPALLGEVRFSWYVSELIAAADMSQRELDDSAVRVVLAFDGDRRSFSTRNAILNELTRALTGEEMPYAVMMYVWSKKRAVGEVIHSPRTDRVRKLVVQSGEVGLNQWMDYRRDIAADFAQVFGEPPGALVGMGVMTDTDNTQTQVTTWYGPLTVHPQCGASVRACVHPVSP